METGIWSLPHWRLAAIVLAYHGENCLWVIARSGWNQVKVMGGEGKTALDAELKMPETAPD